MEYLGLIVLIIIIGLIFVLQQKKEDQLLYKQKQYFFSYSELQFFYILQEILNRNFGKKYGIFPKVRLADIFEPNHKNQSLLNKIWSKHIDFLIVDLERHCNPILGIELNGESHKKRSVMKNDFFKKEIFEKTGVKLAYFNNKDVNSPDFIEGVLFSYLGNINTPGTPKESITINSTSLTNL